MAIPLITNLPPAPSRLETEETFVPKADALLSQLPTFVEETNTSITGINTTADQVTADKATTGQFLLDAETARDAAISSSVYKGTWEGKTSAGVIGESYSYQGSYIYRLNVNLANLSTSVPSPTNTDWQLINVVPFEAPCKPTLDLDFANQKAVIYSKLEGFVEKPFSDIVTQSRATAGTSTDAIGGVTEFAAGENRFTFDGETGEALGYSSEESRTNLLTYSEDFTNAAWAKTGLSVSTSSEPSPSSSSDTFQLIEDNSNGLHSVSTTFSGTPSTTYTFTFYVKTNGRSVLFGIGHSAGGCQIAFNLLNGSSIFTVPTGNNPMLNISAGIDTLASGFYKMRVTATTPATSTGGYSASIQLADETKTAPINVYQGDGVSGLYVWGAQLEVGSFPTSYIRTLGSPVTRAADAMTRTLGQEWNPNEGTFVVEFDLTALPQGSSQVNILNSSGGRFFLYSSGVDAGQRLKVFDGSTVLEPLPTTTTPTGMNTRVAISFTKTTKSASVNGVKTASNTSNGSLTTAAGILLANLNYTGTIKRLQYYPRAFDALTLQRLSRIQ